MFDFRGDGFEVDLESIERHCRSMLGILIQIVTLAALMYLIARHEADISWPKLFLVFVPMIFAIHLLGVVIGAAALLVYLAGIITALKLWFYVDWPKASLIGVAQLVLTILISIGLVKIAV